ncbi:MAG: hypothetical protein ACMUIU_11345 [bacterium]
MEEPEKEGHALKDLSQDISDHDTYCQNKRVKPGTDHLLEHPLFYPYQAEDIGADCDKQSGGQGKGLYYTGAEIGDETDIITQRRKDSQENRCNETKKDYKGCGYLFIQMGKGRNNKKQDKAHP